MSLSILASIRSLTACSLSANREGRCPILDHDEAVENFVDYLTDRA